MTRTSKRRDREGNSKQKEKSNKSLRGYESDGETGAHVEGGAG